jgi:SPP1 gp7 family putative phage head morphogenesis protein
MLERYGEAKRHAKNVALDQTRKAYMSINTERMRDVGVSKFEWIHTGGSQDPRQYHKTVLNGNVYDINDPPVIDQRTGERGLPGLLPFCRCTMRPVVTFEDDSSE